MVAVTRREALIGAALAVLATRAGAQATLPPGRRWQEFDALCAGAVTERRTPGLSATVAQSARILFTQAYGWAELASRRAATPETPFSVASVTKQFVAVLFLLLGREGRLTLGDAVARWLPEFPHARDISLLMLLNHTSGLRDYSTIPRRRLIEEAGRDYSNEEIVARMAATRPLLEFAPGTRWAYSNTGYVLLGAIAERAADQELATLLRERLFLPAGLVRTSWGPPGDGSGARGYQFSGGAWAPIPYVSPSYIGASGAIWSTAADLCAWQAALHSDRILKPAEHSQLLAPTIVPGSGARRGASAYGLGIRTGEALGRSVYWHTGSTAGFAADLRYYPETGVSIALVANADASRMGSFPAAARQSALDAVKEV